MQLKSRNSIKFLMAVAFGLAICIAGATPAGANCGLGSVISWSPGPTGAGGFYVNCGDNIQAFFWMHKQGVQGVLTAAANTAFSNTAGGLDCGSQDQSTLGFDGAGFGLPGAFILASDWGNTGTDGCITNSDNLEADTSYCGGLTAPTIGPMDLIVAGQNPADHDQAFVGVASVDFNQATQNHDFGQAGAPVADGNACNATGDGGSYNDTNLSCGVLPKPAIGGASCTAAGCTLQISVPANPTPPTYADDCLIAASKAVNCPRDIGGDYEVMFQRGSCTVKPTNLLTFNNPGGGTQFATDTTLGYFFCPLSREDLNLNCVLDNGEDGANGGVVNGVLDPQVITSGTAPVFVPIVSGANDCLYLGFAYRVDPNPINKFTIQHQPVISPYVSMNAIPVRAGSATPAADKVFNLKASKAAGKAGVSWDTTAEFETAGFNLIGAKKNGATVSLNSSLIQAKKGNTGEGASYSVSLGAGDLKGSTEVYVELVKTNGAKERFGPASF